MKQTYILFYLVLLHTTFLYNQDNKPQEFSPKITNSYEQFIGQSANFIKKYAGIIITLPYIWYYQNDVITSITNHPYISGCSFYFLLHYLCDCIIEYEKTKKLLLLSASLKKIGLYLSIL